MTGWHNECVQRSPETSSFPFGCICAVFDALCSITRYKMQYIYFPIPLFVHIVCIHIQHRHRLHTHTHSIVQRRESVPCGATTCLYMRHAQRLRMLLIKVWILAWDNRCQSSWRNRQRSASEWLDVMYAPYALPN